MMMMMMRMMMRMMRMMTLFKFQLELRTSELLGGRACPGVPAPGPRPRPWS